MSDGIEILTREVTHTVMTDPYTATLGCSPGYYWKCSLCGDHGPYLLKKDEAVSYGETHKRECHDDETAKATVYDAVVQKTVHGWRCAACGIGEEDIDLDLAKLRAELHNRQHLLAKRTDLCKCNNPDILHLPLIHLEEKS